MKKSEATAKLWQKLVGVEEYFLNGISTQLRGATTFGGENAEPIRDAYLAYRETKPFIGEDIRSLAEKSLDLAAAEFNRLLDVLRRVVSEPSEKKKEQMVNACLSASLNRFRDSLSPIREIIPLNIEEPTRSTINITGNNYGSIIKGVWMEFFSRPQIIVESIA